MVLFVFPILLLFLITDKRLFQKHVTLNLTSTFLLLSLGRYLYWWTISPRVRKYLKFSVRHRTDRMQISASPTKKLVVLQFVKLLTTKDD